MQALFMMETPTEMHNAVRKMGNLINQKIREWKGCHRINLETVTAYTVKPHKSGLCIIVTYGDL